MSGRSERRLAAERDQRLRRLLRDRHIVRVDELSAELGVSAATIRRDLLSLERAGAVRRVHGGAVAVDGRLEEPLFDDKTSIAARQKLRIARAAADMIQPGAAVFLDGGSTVLAMAPLLRDRTDVTVLTNSLRVALELSGGGPRLIVVGGELRRLSQTFVGPLSAPLIDQLHVDCAFIGTIGLALEAGLTTTDPREAYTKSLMMSKARQVVLLADGSKLGKVSLVTFGSLARVAVLITDRDAPRDVVAAIRRRKIRMVMV